LSFLQIQQESFGAKLRCFKKSASILRNKELLGIRPILFECGRVANGHGGPQTCVLNDIAMFICNPSTFKKMRGLFFSQKKQHEEQCILKALTL